MARLSRSRARQPGVVDTLAWPGSPSPVTLGSACLLLQASGSSSVTQSMQAVLFLGVLGADLTWVRGNHREELAQGQVLFRIASTKLGRVPGDLGNMQIRMQQV